MGIKLKKVVLFIIVLLLLKCKNETIKKDLKPFTKEDYVLSYKKMVLYGCIDEKTENKFGKLLDNYNTVFSMEVSILFHDIANKADSLGRKYSIKSIKPYEYYGDLKGKIPLFGKCVEYAFSKEVDSIAVNLYRMNCKE